jgi:hypothetical protein
MDTGQRHNNRGFKKAKNLFWYSDSEPNEVLIAFCHLVCLPLAITYDFKDAHWALMFFGIASGAFQLWAVLWSNCLRYRLLAVQAATLIAISTCVNMYMEDLLQGSNTGWVIILIFAIWNTIRVVKEKIEKSV